MTQGAPDSIGPYAIRGELGRGAMGVVYRAHRADLDREFALKVIRPGGDTDPEAIERFAREARAAAGLAGCPGIVAVHDIGESAGQAYFAMDCIAGASLDALISEGELDTRRATELIAGAAEAVQFAHSRGILHRDIKPANLLVDEHGRPWLTDFGLAQTHATGPDVSRLTKSGAILGTPAYMPPEQARAEGLDVRADVYALGATLYEALCSTPPFSGDGVYTVLARVMRDEPTPPHEVEPGVPRDLSTIVLRCLEKDPAQRYPTAGALAEDLRRFLAGEPVQARPPGTVERWRRKIRRRPVPWAMAGGLAAASVVAGAGWGLSSWHASSSRAAQLRETHSQAEAAERDGDWRAAARLWTRESEMLGAGSAAGHASVERARVAETRADAAARAALAQGLIGAGDAARSRWDAADRALVALAPVGHTSLDTERADAAADAGRRGIDPHGAERARLTAERAEADAQAWGIYAAACNANPGDAAAGVRSRADERLAAFAAARLAAAERDGVDGVQRFVVALRRHGGPADRALAAGVGGLSLDSHPSNAVVAVARYVASGTGVLTPVVFEPRCALCAEPDHADEGHTGHTEPRAFAPLHTPLQRVALPMGSYLVTLAADGAVPVRYPVRIGRGEMKQIAAPIECLTPDQIGEGYVWIPPGESELGGDAEGYASWRRHVRHFDGFCLGRFEVTVGESRDWLEAELRAGTAPDAVEGWLPRIGLQSAPYWKIVGTRIDLQGWKPDWPVLSMNWHAAAAYCRWRSTVEGRAVRLPTEAEWERAGRGADGRIFPWGNGFAWDRTLGGHTAVQVDGPRPRAVGFAPQDVSPFGVRDLPGSAREWLHDTLAGGAHPARGGSWASPDVLNFRLTSRFEINPTLLSNDYGFRVRAEPHRR